jgi:hypothetical protein
MGIVLSAYSNEVSAIPLQGTATYDFTPGGWIVVTDGEPAVYEFTPGYHVVFNNMTEREEATYSADAGTVDSEHTIT